MSSFTSSSDSGHGTNPVEAVLALFRSSWLSIAFCVFLILAGGAWYRYQRPREFSRNLADTIITEQLFRAASIEDFDILIMADSSALMGIDAVALSQLSGRRAESLCTVGTIGPRGFAEILNSLSSHYRNIPVIIVMFSGFSLNIPAETFAGIPEEQKIISGTYTRPLSFVRGARSKLFEDFFKKCTFIPSPGVYGIYYGDSHSVRSFISASHGSLIEPDMKLTKAFAGPDFYRYEISHEIESKMYYLRDALKNFDTENVFLGISPFPEMFGDEETYRTRDKTLQKLSEILDIDADHIITLPPSMDDNLFSTFSHMNKQGRDRFTVMLNEFLVEKDAFHSN